VIEPGHAVGSSKYLELLHAIEETGAVWIAGRSGRSITMDGVSLDLLWPDPETLDGVTDANQISVVVRLRFGDFVALLTGDAGAEVEHLLLDRHPDALRAQVLKAGHHGSSTSTAVEFLAAVDPELVIVSAARRNRYGHPSPSVLRRVEDAGIELARTDRDGTVSLRVRPEMTSRWERILR
jgi:competence protein ComEC